MNIKFVALFSLGFVIAIPALADPQIPRFLQAFINVPLTPMATADLNGDGLPDLIGMPSATGLPMPWSLAVSLDATLRGSSNIQFEPVQVITPNTFPFAVYVADLNGDGKPDLTVYGSDASTQALTVSVLLNTTAPGASILTFAPSQDLPITGLLMAVADVNGDGKPDLIIGNGQDNTVSVAINTTTPGATQSSFASQEIVASNLSPISLAVADINGDGLGDLVVATDTGSVAVLLNQTPVGALAPAFSASLPISVGNAFNIVVSDINGDGRPDISGLAYDFSSSYLNLSPYVLLNTTAPGAQSASLAAAEIFQLAGPPCGSASINAVDLNGDGNVDLLVTESSDSGFPENPGGCIGGTFVLTNSTAKGAFPVSFAPYQVVDDFFTNRVSDQSAFVGDFNGDGAPDLVEAYANKLTSFVNLTQSNQVNLDQHGITGSWYSPATSGQGFEIEVYPDAVGAGQGILFAGWFTYDITAAGGRRWYALQGEVDNADPVALLSIFAEVGGNLNAPPIVSAGPVLGQATIDFSDCTHGVFTYQFTDGSERSGTIPLTRLTPSVSCSPAGDNGAAASDYLLSGNWYDPATSGQGLMFDFSPSINNLFAAWYTFRPNGQQVGGGASQDWYTLQSNQFRPGLTSLTGIPIVQTAGGVFDDPAPVTPPKQVGTANIAFQSCNAMTLTYDFTSGDDAGQSGTMNLVRVGPTPQGCSL